MSNGFLGYDTTFMVDFVVCSLALIVPILGYSVFTVKVQGQFVRHRNLQILLTVVLLLAVAAFEIDVRLHGGWENIVNKDPAQPRLSGSELENVRLVLYVHLVFAISSPLLWLATMVLALRRFRSPPAPGPHSRLHRRLGWLSTADITLTALTGLWFYYLAFVA